MTPCDTHSHNEVELDRNIGHTYGQVVTPLLRDSRRSRQTQSCSVQHTWHGSTLQASQIWPDGTKTGIPVGAPISFQWRTAKFKNEGLCRYPHGFVANVAFAGTTMVPHDSRANFLFFGRATPTSPNIVARETLRGSSSRGLGTPVYLGLGTPVRQTAGVPAHCRSHPFRIRLVGR